MTAPTAPAEELSDREITVLVLVADGCTSRQIGKILHLDRTTITKTLTHIFEVLDANSRENAVFLALQQGIIP
jgi:DNA-binding CsgD family transcriptional regulator